MDILSFVQKIMGGALTAGFFAHDFYYTNKYLGLSIAAIVFLIALLSFHVMIYFNHTGIAVIETITDKKRIERFRLIMSTFTTAFCVADCIYNIHLLNENYFSFKNIATTILSLVIVVFPEAVFKIIFIFRKKRDNN